MQFKSALIFLYYYSVTLRPDFLVSINILVEFHLYIHIPNTPHSKLQHNRPCVSKDCVKGVENRWEMTNTVSICSQGLIYARAYE